MSVIRFGVSFEVDLLEELDNYVKENKFSNRSQALRQLVNRHIVERKWMCNNTVAGVITLVYDSSKHDLLHNLSRAQKDFLKEILSVQRLTLNEDHVLEIVAVKGISARLTDLADRLISEKGIQHGKLTMSRVD